MLAAERTVGMQSQSLHVLLVEDDEPDARLLAERLREPGLPERFELERVGRLADALARLEADGRPDAVLLDLGLPDSQGLDTYQQLAELEADVPVVILTGHADDRAALAAVEAGAQDYLDKSRTSGQTLARALLYAVRRRRAQQQGQRRREALLELSERGLSDTPLQELFEAAAATVTHGLEVDASGVVERTADGGLWVRATVGWSPGVGSGPLSDGAGSWAGLVIERDEPVVVEDLAGEPHLSASAVQRASLASGIVVPISDPGGAPRGVVGAFSATPRTYTATELGFVKQVARVLAEVLRRREAEDQLRRSQAWLELVLDQLPGVVYTLDDQLRSTSVAGSQRPVFETDPGDLGRQLSEILDGEQAENPDTVAAAHQRAQAGQPADFDTVARGRVWHGRVRPLQAPDTSARGVIGLVTDVTDQHAQQQALADSQARLQALFDHALDAILLADDDARYLEANPAAEQLTGYSRRELLERCVADLAPPGDQPDVADAWTAFQAAGQQAGEIVLRRRDGQLITVEYRAVANVRPGVHLSMLRDVTDRKRAEQALQRSEQRFRQLAEQLPEAVVQARLVPERSYEYVNPAVERLTGFSRQQFLEDPELLRSRLHPDDRHHFHTDPHALKAAHDVRLRRADGSWVWVQVHSTPVHDAHDQLVAVQTVARDITHEKQHEQALEHALAREQQASQRLRELDDTKNAFLRAVSHELRTPLSSIYGFALTLSRQHQQLTDDRRAQLADRLATNAERLRRLLDDLLDVNRLASGSLEPDRQRLDLAELATDATETVDLARHHLELDLRPTPIGAERAHLERIVANLLTNATRHTPPGSRIWLTTHPTADGGAALTVADDGPGIPDELKTTVFEPFTQGPDAAHAPNPGTGIGLNLVAKLAELHDGHATITDRPGGGTTVRIELPPAPTAAPQHHVTRPSTTGRGASPTGPAQARWRLPLSRTTGESGSYGTARS